MCGNPDDDPSMHDTPRIDWQPELDAAILDVRAMSEALVFAKAEIKRLKRIADVAADLVKPGHIYVDDEQVVAHVPWYKVKALRAALDRTP